MARGYLKFVVLLLSCVVPAAGYHLGSRPPSFSDSTTTTTSPEANGYRVVTCREFKEFWRQQCHPRQNSLTSPSSWYRSSTSPTWWSRFSMSSSTWSPISWLRFSTSPTWSSSSTSPSTWSSSSTSPSTLSSSSASPGTWLSSSASPGTWSGSPMSHRTWSGSSTSPYAWPSSSTSPGTWFYSSIICWFGSSPATTFNDVEDCTPATYRKYHQNLCLSSTTTPRYDSSNRHRPTQEGSLSFIKLGLMGAAISVGIIFVIVSSILTAVYCYKKSNRGSRSRVAHYASTPHPSPPETQDVNFYESPLPTSPETKSYPAHY